MKAIKPILFFASALVLWALCTWANTGFAVDICSEKEIEQISNFSGSASDFSELSKKFPKVAFNDISDGDTLSYQITYRDINTEYYKNVTVKQNDSLLNEYKTISVKMGRNVVDFFALSFNNKADLFTFNENKFSPYKLPGPIGSGFQSRSTLICTNDGYDVYLVSEFDLDHYFETGKAKWEVPVLVIKSYDGKEWNITETYGGSKDGK